MYFLAIAKNTIKSGFITFNQQEITNGFQPLWQYILILVQFVFRPSVYSQLLLTFGLSLFLVILGFFAVIRGARRYWGSREAAILPFLLLPGAFALFFEPTLGHETHDPALLYSFSAWAFVNGMESAVTVFVFGILFMVLLSNLSIFTETTPSIREVFSPSTRILLPLIVLARLDDVFLLASLIITLVLFFPGNLREKTRDIAIVLFPTFIVMSIYVAYNAVTAGVALPISGLSKTQFALLPNVKEVVSLLFSFSVREAYRIIPMVVFIAFGGATFLYGAWTLKKHAPNLMRKENNLIIFLLLPLSGYILLKGLFHFTAVYYLHQGWWYYTGQLFLFNIIVAVALSRILGRLNLGYAFAFLLALSVTGLQIVDTGHRLATLGGYARANYIVWKNHEALNANLTAIDREMKLIDNTDGLYGFILDMPVASGTGLVFSRQERDAADKKGTIDALVERGFTVIPVSRSDAWEGHYLRLSAIGRNADRIYTDPRTSIGFYRLSARKNEQKGPDRTLPPHR